MGKKYIIELEKEETVYKTVDADGRPLIQLLAPIPYTADLDAIRNETWEAARKIGSNSMCSLEEMGFKFEPQSVGYNPSWYVVQNYSASECIEKIRQYEHKQEEIQVGDEVVGTYTGDEETEPFVIIRKIPEIYPTYYFGIYSKSGKFCQGGLKLKKTGRHFPEIAEVLQKMKEDNQDG